MGRVTPEGRREAILEAAVSQLTARGIGAVRLQDVATAAGLSSGLLHYHFSTKDALLAQAVAHQGQRDLAVAQSAALAARPLAERLRAVLFTYAPTGDAGGWRLWIDAWSEALRSPAMREVVEDLDARWHRLVSDLLAEGARTGALAVGDVRATAEELLAGLDGLSVRLVVTSSERGAEGWSRAESRARTHVERIVDGLCLAAR